MEKSLVIAFVTGVFIYFRKLDYYKTIPRESFIASFLIMVWTYYSIKEPWFILIGLCVLNIFGEKRELED